MHVWPPEQSALRQHGVLVAVEQWPGPRWSQFGGWQSVPPESIAGLPMRRACVCVGPP